MIVKRKIDMTNIIRLAISMTAVNLMTTKPKYVDCSGYANKKDALSYAMLVARNAAKCGYTVNVTGQRLDKSWVVIKLNVKTNVN